MAKVNPFHSKKNPRVYHTCSNCTEGNYIEPKDRVPGTGDGKKCATCRRLTRQGKC